MRKNAHVVKHGTNNEYQNYGCRCDECREAARVYSMTRKPCPECGGPMHFARKLCLSCHRDRIAAQHGSLQRYANGCRCSECRAASTASKRRGRERHPEWQKRENQRNREARRQYRVVV